MDAEYIVHYGLPTLGGLVAKKVRNSDDHICSNYATYIYMYY